LRAAAPRGIIAFMVAPVIKCFLAEADGKGGFRWDGGDWRSINELPAGAMFFADWYSRKGPDGRHLVVKTPGGLWHIDGRASNCTMPDDKEHRCWVRHGVAPNITVDKNGNTCGCGCSIGQGENWKDYHGFLRNGELVSV
jgi:hypothetical protein